MNIEKNHIKILGIPIDRVDFLTALRKIEGLMNTPGHHQICTVNPEFIMHSMRDEVFRAALVNSSLNTPDGIGVIWAAKFLNKKSKIKNKKFGSRFATLIANLFWLKITLLAIIFNKKWLSSEFKERVTGIDLMWELCNRAQEHDWKIFLLGGQKGVSEKVAENIKAIYPKINIVGTYAGSPEPSRDNSRVVPTNDGPEDIIQHVAKTKPNILFVAYGSPKGEKFIYQNLNKLNAKVVVGVGGSFDFIVGRAKRAPRIFQVLGIEWLFRFLQQPRRIGRIINAFPKFVWKVFVENTN